MSKDTILIRADANVAIGTGHVMRCLALAQAWQDAGGDAIFAMADCSSSLKGRLQKELLGVLEISPTPGSPEDARQTAHLAHAHSAAWVTVDGYHFGADYQRTLRAAGLKIFFLDDYGHARDYCADVVLNQNLSADECLYERREPYSRLLLGPRYCMLRREFHPWREQKREIAPLGHRVLVTMGGSDPQNFTEKAINALRLIDDPKLDAAIVVGGSNLHSQSLQGVAAGIGKRVGFYRDAQNIAELMAWADIAISAAGTTSWELCMLGLPSILISLAENQVPVAQELHSRGCAIHLGGPQQVSSEILATQAAQLLNSENRRRGMSSDCRDLLDGRGAMRVVAALRGPRLHLRPACESDSRLLWEWANDPQVRSASFSSEPIPWETHVAWFARKLKQHNCFIWIAEDDEQNPVGQIRLDTRADGESEVDVSISNRWRGQRLGVQLVRMAAQSALNGEGRTRLHAFVKLSNVASLKAFEKGGFMRVGVEKVGGNEAVHLVCEAN